MNHVGPARIDLIEFLETPGLFLGEIGKEVNAPGHQLHVGCVHIAVNTKFHFVQEGLLPVIVLKAFHDEAYLRRVADKFKRTGTDGMLVLLLNVPGHDRCIQEAQEIRIQLFGLHHNLFAVVFGPDIRKTGQLRNFRFTAVKTGRAAQRPDDIVRSHAFAIMKFHLIFQHKAQSPAIFFTCPRFRQAGHKFALDVHLDETFKKVEKNFFRAGRHGQLRIEKIRLLGNADNNLAAPEGFSLLGAVTGFSSLLSRIIGLRVLLRRITDFAVLFGRCTGLSAFSLNVQSAGSKARENESKEQEKGKPKAGLAQIRWRRSVHRCPLFDLFVRPGRK